MIDLRSDTVTKPTPGMRAAMAQAEVGDDVWGEDPTVNRLQARVAELLGKDAALFVPSGSMANQICLKVHTQPGDDVIVGEGAHNYFYESGAGAVVSGVQFTVVGKGGLFTWDEVEEAIKPDNHHCTPTRLVCLENTHNRGGGRIWPQTEAKRIAEEARQLGLATHLDGARLFNAHVVTGLSLRELASPFDSVSVCLSKGLGAPVGSLLSGSREFVHRAHRVRKLLGGAMRQAGILAAAGLYALDHHIARLAEDHQNARVLYERLRNQVVSAPETNMVFLELTKGTANELADRTKERGVLVHAIGPRRVRLVTHLDVDTAACQRASDILLTCIDSL